MIQNIEKTKQLILDFKKCNSSQMASAQFNGLLPVVVQDETSKKVLLLAYINVEFYLIQKYWVDYLVLNFIQKNIIFNRSSISLLHKINVSTIVLI